MPLDVLPEFRIPTVRISPSPQDVIESLGPLGDLPGFWEGHGFNLVARPNFEHNTNLFLELNLTQETLKFDPISTSVPNRGVAQNDTELFGLTYLQKISDRTTGGALHIEPGIWTFIKATTNPDLPKSVARMGTIPHGNALLAEGIATPFSGPPALGSFHATDGANPAFSAFPSFNSTPFPVSAPPLFFAAGSSEAASAPPATHGGFTQYTLSDPTNESSRTPSGNIPPVLPPEITQELINDPIILLQKQILHQQSQGHTFEGTALNIATEAPLNFATAVNATTPVASVSVTAEGGSIGNIPFLQTNANAATVYATFWITKVSHPKRRSFMQLHYAQMVLLNFPAILIPGKPNFSWPHVSVGTLTKVFG